MGELEREELVQHLLQMIYELDGFSIIDRERRYLYVSPKWSDAMGMTLEDLKDLRAGDLFEDSQSDVAMRTGKSIVDIPVRWGRDKVPGLINYYPFRDENGAVQGCYCLVMLAGMDKAREVRDQISGLICDAEKLRKTEKGLEQKYGIDSILGDSSQMQKMKEQIRRVARSNSSVLIEGETGTGKELVAHAIQDLSRRREGPFVRVNCSAIPAELIEAELFGYEKGAFTGASSTGRAGRFRSADGGTIFLDEINSLPLHMQPKLLRVLQEREVEPIGGEKTIPVDIRVIAAANVPLLREVQEGRFREDLYYRLNVIRIQVPPLRERKEDIPLLVHGMIDRFNAGMGTYIQGISNEALELLTEYEWPGNVRELQNAVEAAVNLENEAILQRKDFYELSARLQSRRQRLQMLEGMFNLVKARENFEKELIKEALRRSGNYYTDAARMLGISRTALYNKLEQYGLKEKT